MVQKHIVIRHDDIDGTEGAETVMFAIDGKHYEIDLKPDHAAELRDHLGRFVGAATLIGPAKGGRGRPARAARAVRTHPATDKARLNAIREWARMNGYTVADRGRIPTHIEAAYNAKH